ncbi:MAG: signal peptidase II [Spirochaetales bacterium]|nr:MAG: signal peptidase II [Spirochaetales bacterium]
MFLKRYRYFLLTALILAADQITKLMVVRAIPLYTVAWNFGGDFFRLIHVRNTGVAFGMGGGFSDVLRAVLFIAVPLLVLIGAAVYMIRDKNLSSGMRWVLAAIVGGGMGNQIDRVFRPEGVVDFLDFKFYGLFGLERWPTFNVADATLVVSAVLAVILMIREER